MLVLLEANLAGHLLDHVFFLFCFSSRELYCFYTLGHLHMVQMVFDKSTSKDPS